MQYTFDMSTSRSMIKNHMNLGGKNQFGESININSLYLTKNGKPWIPIMGELHFSRIKRENWETEIMKVKAGGVTAIATYVFWIYHEEKEGVFDFSGDNDIHEFLRLCKKHDMRVALRIGPWAHGEARNGGFPDWLLKKDFKLRDNNDEYLKLVRIFYTKIYEQVKDFLFDNDGTIPVIQLENELVNHEDHLLKLKEIAKEVGLVAPIYTVTGWNSIYGAEIPTYEVMPVFGGYPEAPWTAHTNKLTPSSNYFFINERNDSAIGTDLISKADDNANVKKMDYNLYPFATCELGGGICVTYHRRPNIKGDDVGALALVKLGCGNNLPGYYMYHGGTNQIGELSTFNESKATGYPNDYPILSYDFQAPIGEYGLIRPQYNEFKIQHLFLNDFMEYFAPMDAYMPSAPITSLEDTDSLRYAMRMKHNSGFVFVNNYQRITDMGDKKDVQFSIPMTNGTNFVFPEKPVNIENGKYFMLPFNLDMNGTLLKYATAQLLCRKDNTYFFFAIDGIDTEYVFENETKTVKVGFDSGFDIGGIHIVTLTREQALMTYKFDGEVYVGNGNMYFDGNKITVYKLDDTDVSYWHYENREFVKTECIAEKVNSSVTFVQDDNLSVDEKYFYELKLGGAQNIKKWKLDLSDLAKTEFKQYLSVDYVGDVAQIYADGKLVADEYYYGQPWIIDADIVKNAGEVVLVISQLDKQDVYFETEKTNGCDIFDVTVKAEYKN